MEIEDWVIGIVVGLMIFLLINQQSQIGEIKLLLENITIGKI